MKNLLIAGFIIITTFPTSIVSTAQSDSLPVFEDPAVPIFPGGENDLVNYIYARLSEGDFGDGIVHVRFSLDSTGKVYNPEIARTFNRELNTKLIKIFDDFPKFDMYGNRQSTYVMPIFFGEKRLSRISYNSIPRYVGGEEAMITAIRMGLKQYSNDSINDTMPQKMMVYLNITKTGKVMDVEVKKSSKSEVFDKAVVDVCSNLKYWIPATNANSEFVDMGVLIPISFHLK